MSTDTTTRPAPASAPERDTATARTERVGIHDLGVSFGNFLALEGIDLSIWEKEFISIVGASGCGKSTLLSTVAGLLEQDSGVIEVDGEPITGPGRDRGVVFQGYTLLPWRTARANIEFALLDEPMSKAERRKVAEERLADVGLSEFADRHPAELSGGMQQRVAIARSLAYHPRILLMDEPFGALDALTRRSMQELLTRVCQQHALTVMLVTHDIEEAVLLSDRVVVMAPHPGRIVAEHVVDLPRPRTSDMLYTPEARDLAHRITAEVMESQS